MSSRSWFSRALLPWYDEHHRDLPWRRTRDPYAVWLSEVILQQTRVEQGLSYYLRFIARYSTVAHLARAREPRVLKLWQGLGYYTRARNLVAAARQVMREHEGRFPHSYAALLQLKGVGDYTAAAIASICHGEAVPVVDGNVYRVLARVFGINTPIDGTAGRKQFRELAGGLIDHKRPGDHNQAVMELGATICTPRKPQCDRCPLRSRCIARQEDRIAFLPMRSGRSTSRIRHFNYLHVRSTDGLYLQKRMGKDIWRGLYELPLIESDRSLTRTQMQRRCAAMLGAGSKVGPANAEVTHILSHQVIHAVFWHVDPPRRPRKPTAWKFVPHGRTKGYPVPRLIERWLERDTRSTDAHANTRLSSSSQHRLAGRGKSSKS